MTYPDPRAGVPLTLSAGTCFKLGFLGALGAACFGLIVSVILGILGLIFGAGFLGFLTSLR